MIGKGFSSCPCIQSKEGVPHRQGCPRYGKEQQQLCGKAGGPGGARTRDLFHAMEARSQLRHRPSAQQVLFNAGERVVNAASQFRPEVREPFETRIPW